MAKLLERKARAWAPTTLRSETARLRTLVRLLETESRPASVVAGLARAYGSYAAATAWVRVRQLAEEAGEDVRAWDRAWRDRPREMRQAYRRRLVDLTPAQVLGKLAHVEDVDVRAAAAHMLRNGLRACEAGQAGGSVVGKGAKEREVLFPGGVAVSYGRLHRALRKVGLRPHDLRKVFATDLWRRHPDVVDVAKVMGWQSFETARSYVAPRSLDDVRRRFG